MTMPLIKCSAALAKQTMVAVVSGIATLALKSDDFGI